MATVVRNLAQFDDGKVQWSYSYNDATLRLLTFDCVNNGISQTTGTLTSQADPTATVTATVQPGEELHQNVPVGVANRFDIGVDARGRLTGIDHSFTG